MLWRSGSGLSSRSCGRKCWSSMRPLCRLLSDALATPPILAAPAFDSTSSTLYTCPSKRITIPGRNSDAITIARHLTHPESELFTIEVRTTRRILIEQFLSVPGVSVADYLLLPRRAYVVKHLLRLPAWVGT